MRRFHRNGIVTLGLLVASFSIAEAQKGDASGQIPGLVDVNFNAQLNGTAIGIPVPGFPNPPEININGAFVFEKSPKQLDLVGATFHHFVNVSGPLFRSHDGTFVLTASDGSTMIGTFLGAIRPPNSTDPISVGHSYWLVTNGTGRFAGALGSGDFTSELAMGAGGLETATLKWKGVVTVPDARP
jgi:hypothetical protein